MKEIIYLDSDAINSYLAQIDEGLMAKISKSLSMIKEEGEETSSSSSTSVEGKASIAVASASLNQNEHNMEKESIVYSTNNSDLVDKVLDDFSLNLLLDKLHAKNFLNKSNLDNLKDGSFVHHEDNFAVFDFSMLEKTMEKETVNLFNSSERENARIQEEINHLKKINDSSNSKEKLIIKSKIQELNKKRKPPISGFGNFDDAYRFGKFGNILFSDSCLFKINNLLMVCAKENLRVNEATLSLLNSTERKINILGTVIFKRKDTLLKKDEFGNILQLEVNVIASSAQLLFSEIILDNLGLSQLGDYYVRPMAIYFNQS